MHSMLGVYVQAAASSASGFKRPQRTINLYHTQLIVTIHGDVAHPRQGLVSAFLDNLKVSNLRHKCA
jgi:hypothetical protein